MKLLRRLLLVFVLVAVVVSSDEMRLIVSDTSRQDDPLELQPVS